MKPKILVIGGSFAGLCMYRHLYSYYDITVVDPKEFFEYTPGILVAFVDPNHYDKLVLKYKQAIKKGKFIQGIVTQLDTNSATVKLTNGRLQNVSFDYCIICCGSSYPPPIKDNTKTYQFSEKKQQIQQQNTDLKNSNQVLVVGGGAVGVELVCELAQINKNVTLATRGPNILDAFPKKAQISGLNSLTGQGVKILLNTRKEDIDYADYGVIFECIGNKYNNSHFMNQNFKHCLDFKGRILVNTLFQVKNQDSCYQHIFSIGDACLTEANEEKVALHAELQAEMVSHNFVTLYKYQQKYKRQIDFTEIYSKLQKYPQSSSKLPKVYAIQLGKNQGIVVFNRLCFTSFLCVWIKKIIEKLKILQLKGNLLAIVLWNLMHILVRIFNRIL